MSDLLAAKNVRAPQFGSGEWLNIEGPLTREALRGQVVLVDFWDYTCINCIRTLPYVRAWHERYHDKGLITIGVHAPEFAFARSRRQIEMALDEFGLAYPILLDNNYETWERFANCYWPAKYLIDETGYIRYMQHGEGHYQTTERAIQTLLTERDREVELLPLLEPLRAEDTQGAICYRPTPELYTGLRHGALGNPEGYASGVPVIYRMPLNPQRENNAFYAEGIWQAEESYFAFAGQDNGRLLLPYQATGVNAVLSPSGDPLEVMLDLKQDKQTVIELRQDGKALARDVAGSDVVFEADGAGVVYVTRPRMYQLVQSSSFADHELELIFHANGLAVFAFTFTSCVAAQGATSQRPTFVAD